MWNILKWKSQRESVFCAIDHDELKVNALEENRTCVTSDCWFSFYFKRFFLHQCQLVCYKLLCDSRMKKRVTETDCQRETEGKGQVATNDDDADDNDDHVVSREICMRSWKGLCYYFFFLQQSWYSFFLRNKYIYVYIYEMLQLIISFIPSSFYFAYQHLFFFSRHAIFAVVPCSVKSLRNLECTYTHARIIIIIDKKA